MAERSDKHGPMTDDQMHREVEDIERSGVTSHADEDRDPEPAGEGQPDVDRVPHGDASGGTPPGMGEGDIELRAELARFAKPAGYPTDRAQLLATMRAHYAPDYLVAMVQRLDPERTIHTATELAEELGLNTEDRRF